MDDERHFEQQVAVVTADAARAAALAQGAIDEASATVSTGDGDGDGDGSGGRMASIARRLGLSTAEVDFVWTAVARAVEPRVGAHLRTIYGNDARLGVSLGQHIGLRRLDDNASRSLLAIVDSRHPLQQHGLLLTVADDSADVGTRFTVAPRLWDYLRGGDALDPIVAELGGVVLVPTAARLSLEQEAVVLKLRSWLAAATAPTVVLEGASGSGRRTAVALAAVGRAVIAVDFARVAPRRALSVLAALRRDAFLADAIAVLANLDELASRLPPGDEITLAIAAAIDAIEGPLVVTTSTPGLELHATRRSAVRVRWAIPDIATRRALWLDAVPTLPPESLDVIAIRYAFGAGGVTASARSAHHHAGHRGVGQPSFTDVVAGVQDNIAERLGELARRVEVRQTWSELVLSPDILDDVRAVIGRVRHAHHVLEDWGFKRKLARGTGVAALFSGPPGTGKTMVAGLIARELELELFQVDLSRIVSKWVGETEKQLAKVFDAAEAGHALLLFDEADSLFAKRSSDVKSAVDRYANLEVNYLLQRVESFGGVVILTTNLDTSIDPALRRRLAGHVVFGAPDVDERERLWREMLATGAPVDKDVDLAAMSEEFAEMTGANIRNAVLAAAFLAAEEGKTIGASHLRRAARGEYRAMGRVLGRDHRGRSAGE
jgi:ATPase family associated with various cellular activities (AAA)